MKKTKFDINIEERDIFKALEIKENTEAFVEAGSVFEECKNIFYDKVEPLSLYEVKNEKIKNYDYAIFVIISVGNNINEAVNDFFNKGEYFKGFLLNGICDYYLMKMDKVVIEEISKFICNIGIGFGERFYPHENIESEKMNDIIEGVNGYEYGMTVNESFVLNPVKSLGFIIGAKKDINNDIMHNCKDCLRRDCKWRKSDD